MTDHLKDLDAAAELGKKATERPWTVNGHGVANMTDLCAEVGLVGSVSRWVSGMPDPNDENGYNGCYIVASANLDHAAIAAAWRAKDAEIARLKSELDKERRTYGVPF